MFKGSHLISSDICMHLWNHHHKIKIMNEPIIPQSAPLQSVPPCCPPLPCLFPDIPWSAFCHDKLVRISYNFRSMDLWSMFSAWVLTLGRMRLRSTRVIGRVDSAILFIAQCTDPAACCCCFDSLADRHWGCVQFGVKNKAAMNIHIQAFLWTYLLIYLGEMPKSRIAGL